MPRLVSNFSHNLFYTSEVSSIIRGHHLYMSVWSSTVGETLSTRPDNREEAKVYDKFAIVVYKGDLLVGDVPIEISSFFYHFLNNNEQNTLTVIVTEKRMKRLILLCSETVFFKQKTENLLNHWKLSLQRGKIYFQLWLLSSGKKE